MCVNVLIENLKVRGTNIRLAYQRRMLQPTYFTCAIRKNI